MNGNGLVISSGEVSATLLGSGRVSRVGIETMIVSVFIALRTCVPFRYETVTIETELPPLKFAPQILMQLWDWDQASSDDFVSDGHLSLMEPGCVVECTSSPYPVRKPRCHPVRWRVLLAARPRLSGGRVD